jgi:pentatricopeptide repeat protein
MLSLLSLLFATQLVQMVILSVIIKIYGQLMLYDCFIYQVAEEMESYGIQPKHRTFLALLKSCGTAGRVDEAYGVVRRMAACGLNLNSSCYSALIMAYKNRKPVNEDTVHKVALSFCLSYASFWWQRSMLC